MCCTLIVVRSVTIEQRRARLVTRHHLAGDAAGPEAVVHALVALHATDPASVYLSVLARSRATSIEGVAEAMYDRRVLVRWMAMRRTLFVFHTTDVPLIQAAVSTPLAATLRRQLISRMQRNGVEPEVAGDLGQWLDEVEQQVEHAAVQRGSATGPELRHDVPALGSRILPGAPSESPQNLTSPLLTVMSSAGRLVRGEPTGTWTSRGHRWEPSARWWPEGLPVLDPHHAATTLAHRWLQRFGPATIEDLQWWTGWNLTTTRRALTSIDLEEVDLHGRPGIDLPDQHDAPDPAPVAALLPALDPTPMGWRHRDWFTGTDTAPLYDRAGNIGPTIWWNGQIIGGWASTPTGIRTRIFTDPGRTARDAIDHAADALQQRLGDTVVTPAARTPTERSLTTHLPRLDELPRG